MIQQTPVHSWLQQIPKLEMIFQPNMNLCEPVISHYAKCVEKRNPDACCGIASCPSLLPRLFFFLTSVMNEGGVRAPKLRIWECRKVWLIFAFHSCLSRGLVMFVGEGWLGWDTNFNPQKQYLGSMICQIFVFFWN